MKLIWEYEDRVEFDSTVIFGKGYCFDGLDNFPQSASGVKGNYLIWPNTSNKKYSLYRDTDGAMSFENFSSEDEAMKRAQEWEDE